MVLAQKYNLDAMTLWEKFREAIKHRSATCEKLKIESRQATEKDVILLVSQNSSVIAQVRLERTSLANPERARILFNKLSRSIQFKETREPADSPYRIRDLEIGSRHVNIQGKVLEKGQPKSVLSRMGEPLLVSTALITDGTGKIKLTLWNEQVNSISVGDIVQVQNGKVGTFKGEMRLGVSRSRGKLNVIKQSTNLAAAQRGRP